MKVGTKKILFLVMIFSLATVISGCKSQKTIKKNVQGLINFYDKTPLLEKFASEENRNSSLSNSRTVKNKEEDTYTVLYLKYYPEEAKFYGEYIKKEIIQDTGVEEVSETRVMLDKEGYHVKEGQVLTEEIKNFKFMFEEVDLSEEYLKSIELTKAVYGFEIPDYSMEYKLTKKKKDIENYLERLGSNFNGLDGELYFNVSARSSNGGTVRFYVDEKREEQIFESISYSGGNENNYKEEFHGEEVTE